MPEFFVEQLILAPDWIAGSFRFYSGHNHPKHPAVLSSVLFHLKLAFCCWLAGLMARRERGAYPLRYVTSEQRSQRACEPQPSRGAGADRHLLRCRSSTMRWGIDCVAAPCICLHGARAKMESFRWDRTLDPEKVREFDQK